MHFVKFYKLVVILIIVDIFGSRYEFFNSELGWHFDHLIRVIFWWDAAGGDESLFVWPD